MKPLKLNDVNKFVNDNIVRFHANKIKTLESLKSKMF